MLSSTKFNMYIVNETTTKNSYKEDTAISFKFSIRYKNKPVFINRKILDVLLHSTPIKRFILSDCIFFIRNNNKYVTENINKIYYNIKKINVKIRLIGKYFFLDVYCGNNHTIEDIITALNLKINNRRDNFDILMG